jgi:preprotein translocase subunit SecD
MISSSSRSAAYGLFFWTALAVIGSYLVFPLERHLKLGIDLVGGFYITLQVQTDEAVKMEIQERMLSSMHRLRENQLPAPINHRAEGTAFFLTFSTIEETHKALQCLKTHLGDESIHTEGMTIVSRLTDNKVQEIKNWSVESNVEILRKRLDKTGVAEVSVSRHGEKNIIIELPNVDDPDRAKEMIGKTAQLEIKLVEGAASSEDDLLDRYDGILPEGMMIVTGKENGEHTRYYLVSDYAEISGRDLKNAQPSLGGRTNTEPVVTFEFKPEGGEKFYELTSKNVGRQLAVIVDGVVYSAAVINEAIRHSGSISGGFTWESAQDLATALKSGAFVARVTFEEERRIGPSLGSESIRQGFMACLIGMAVLFIFSLWYKVSGLLAFTALLYNLLLIIFSMAWLNATLTLPGIAGMVLTIGMAIDSSILVFEKVKELLKSGMTYRKAIEEGFSDAMVVILDANITTFLMGAVLYWLGTGPIQGFAVTMMLGILSTLVTGFFFLRSLFRIVLHYTGAKELSI